jgi:hypothetical protein
MTTTIKGLAFADKHLLAEITEIVERTQAQAVVRPRRSARRVALAAAILGAAAGLTLLAAPSVRAEGTPRVAQEYHACAVVLGLDPADQPYQDCISNLDRTLPRSGASAATGQAPTVASTQRHQSRLACTAAGLDPASPAFAECVATINRSLWESEQIYR